MSDEQKTDPKRPYRILLVEDSDYDAQRIQRGVARLNGYGVITRVQNAASAVAYLKGEGEFNDPQQFPYPDIVLLDLNMSQSDGFEVLQWAQRRLPRPVIAVFCAPDGETTRKRAEQLGVDLYETDVWDPTIFERFIHFTGNIVEVKRRHGS